MSLLDAAEKILEIFVGVGVRERDVGRGSWLTQDTEGHDEVVGAGLGVARSRIRWPFPYPLPATVGLAVVRRDLGSIQ